MGRKAGVKHPLDCRHCEYSRGLREDSLKGKKQSPELVEKRRQGMLGMKASPTHRQNLSAANRRSWQTPSLRQMASENALRRWQDPNYRASMLLHLRSIQSPTSIETQLGTLLREAFPEERLEREYQVGRYRIDWALPGLMLAYEADGEYWHSRPGVQEKDERRDTWLQEQGWNVIRIPETEMNRWL